MIKLVIVMPATNPVSEPSFSAMRRLNNAMMLHWTGQTVNG